MKNKGQITFAIFCHLLYLSAAIAVYHPLVVIKYLFLIVQKIDEAFKTMYILGHCTFYAYMHLALKRLHTGNYFK